jgi:pyridoxine 5-phosphate synthase
MPRLCINLNHIASLRESRKGSSPDPVAAWTLAWLGGADAIAVHLRTDRRHVQERDVEMLRSTVRVPLRLRLANSSQLVHEATALKPDLVTVVPERREEVTTESGIDVLLERGPLQRQIKELHEAGLRVGLFVEPDLEQVRTVAKAGADVVELDAYHYGNATGDAVERERERLETAARAADKLGLEVHVGHGLDYETAAAVGRMPGISEVQVGHSVVARSVLVGLREAVGEFRSRLHGR